MVESDVNPRTTVKWLSQAEVDVLAERRRQREVEGWTDEHDDAHRPGQLAAAGATYAYFASLSDEDREYHGRAPYRGGLFSVVRYLWPSYPGEAYGGWSWNWWKPKDRRRDLIRAGALVLAEIERLDREAERAREKAA